MGKAQFWALQLNYFWKRNQIFDWTNITAAPHICSVPKLAWLISIPPHRLCCKHVILADGFHFKSTGNLWTGNLDKNSVKTHEAACLEMPHVTNKCLELSQFLGHQDSDKNWVNFRSCMSNKFWFSLKTSFVDNVPPQSVFCFSTFLFYEQEPGRYKKASLQNAELKQSHIFKMFCSCYFFPEMALFQYMVKHSLKHFFFYFIFFPFFSPVEVNRDVSTGLRQHENMVIVWLDFLKKHQP